MPHCRGFLRGLFLGAGCCPTLTYLIVLLIGWTYPEMLPDSEIGWGGALIGAPISVSATCGLIGAFGGAIVDWRREQTPAALIALVCLSLFVLVFGGFGVLTWIVPLWSRRLS